MIFEYKVFNMSEVTEANKTSGIKMKIDKAKADGNVPLTLIDLLNFHGKSGWEVIFKLKDNSYLMKRVVTN